MKYLSIKNVPKNVYNKFINIKEFFFNKFGDVPRICRIDFLRHGFKYEILEIELIDPDLFIRHIPSNIRNKVLNLLTK